MSLIAYGKQNHIFWTALLNLRDTNLANFHGILQSKMLWWSQKFHAINWQFINIRPDKASCIPQILFLKADKAKNRLLQFNNIHNLFSNRFQSIAPINSSDIRVARFVSVHGKKYCFEWKFLLGPLRQSNILEAFQSSMNCSKMGSPI